MKQKEDEQKSRKAKEAEMISVLKEKELAKAESMKKIESDMKDQRERRLKLAEKQRGKLETQLLMSRGVVPKSMLPPEMQRAQAGEQPESGPLRQQRVMHRHVHHHVHYHDEEEGVEMQGGMGAQQLEYDSEAQARAQMES